MAIKSKKLTLRLTPQKKTADVGYHIRLAACVLAFLAAMFYWARSCAALANNLLILINPSMKVTVLWSVHLALSSLILIVMVAVAAALLRPVWVGILTFALGACLFPLVVGFGLSTWISAAILFLLLLLNLIFVNSQMKNQIQFSSHPTGEKKIIVATLLSALVCVSLGIGYMRDSAKRNYVFPPEATAFFSKAMMKTAQTQIDAAKLPEPQRQGALKETETKVATMISDAEAKVKPYQKYIAIGLGVFAFFFIPILFLLIALLSAPLIPLVFLALRAVHFTRMETEKVEVSRLTLRSAD